MKSHPTDDIDRRILRCLQENSSLSVAEVARRVGLSTTPCWRRIQRLEKGGVIRKRVALLDPASINVGVTVFVRVRTTQHRYAWFESFAQAVAGMDEVTGFYRLSGDIDYLLRVSVPDIAAYDEVYRRLISAVELADVTASFVMETIKDTTSLPLDYIER
jgi:Lrp/AsnC family transcriptional regulator